MIDLTELITINPSVRGGKPCIRGTRITVCDILEYMAGGMSDAEILSDFPSLTAEQLRALLVFAAQRERRLAASAPLKLLLDENLSPQQGASLERPIRAQGFWLIKTRGAGPG